MKYLGLAGVCFLLAACSDNRAEVLTKFAKQCVDSGASLQMEASMNPLWNSLSATCSNMTKENTR